MKTLAALALLLTIVPVQARAAEQAVFTGKSVLIATTTVGNVYALGGAVAVTTPISADLTVIAGTLDQEAHIAGDLTAVGGSLHIAGPVAGDFRGIGGSIAVTAPIEGDLVVIGGSFTDSSGSARQMLIAGANVTLSGARGPVTVYANNVALSGTYAGDVHIKAAGRVALQPHTVIHGALDYQSPESAALPSDAVIDGGVTYTGASYLPTSKQARAIALASFGVFLFIKILGALILAGLIAGLFPKLVDRFFDRAQSPLARSLGPTLLLGFAILAATPVLILLLSITFVGLGIALVLAMLYFLLLALAFTGAAIILGGVCARYIFKRTKLRATDTVLGMLLLFVLWSIPYLGTLLVLLLTLYALGAFSTIFYRFAFPREGEEAVDEV